MNAKQAKQIYSKIGNLKCPLLLGETIRCTNIGFNHLIRRGRKVRPIEEQIRRFDLIPYIKTVIESSTATIVHERRINESFEIADFWGLSLNIGERMTTVVIRQVGNNGQKHFFSIMDSKIKKTPIRESF